MLEELSTFQVSILLDLRYRLFCLILFLHLSVAVVYFCCVYVVVVVVFFRSVKLLIKLDSLQRRSKVCLIG